MEDFTTNLPPVPTKSPLTNSQIGVYLHCMQYPKSRVYNCPTYYGFDLSVGVDRLTTMIDTCLANHPALFSSIQTIEGEPYMVAGECFPICTHRRCIDSQIPQEKEAFITPFTLDTAPLCRAEIWETETQLLVALDVNHLVFDGTSYSRVAQELNTLLHGGTIQPEIISPFHLYEIQQRMTASPMYQRSKEHFETLLAGVEVDSAPIADLHPTQKPEVLPGATYRVQLTEGFDHQEVSQRLAPHKISYGSFFLSAYAYALAKFTGQTESLFCVGSAGRKKVGNPDCVAMMVSLLPFYQEIDENKSATQFMLESQDQFYRSLRNDGYPLREMVHQFGISTQTNFIYQGDIAKGTGCDFSVTFEQPADAAAALNCQVELEQVGFSLLLCYRTDLYLPTTIERFAQLYQSVLQSFLADLTLAEVPLISQEDGLFYQSLNQTDAPFDRSKTVVDLFREQLARHPDKLALVYKEKTYTYAQLDAVTDKIASYVINQGLTTEDVVSILIPRDEFMGIANLGVIKAGVAYQPLDPTYPLDRLAFMMEDAQAKLLIVNPDLRDLVPDYQGAVLSTDDIATITPIDVLPYAPKPEDLLVLLYTSGSTGAPKGSMWNHSNLAAYTFANCKNLGIDSTSVTTVYSSFGFDAALGDVFSTLVAGAQTHVIPDELRLDLDGLAQYYSDNHMTHIFMTTQVCRQFVPYASKIPSLKVVFTGGEALSPVVLEGGASLLNAYGPSETVCYVCGYRVDTLTPTVPIGTAIANIKLYIVDGNNRQVPVGVPGELCIAGSQVARGYLNRPEQTALSFVENPFCNEEHYRRMYHTGDIVRMLPDGNIEFVGRRDGQVKIRGYRVELTEVEGVIKDYPAISDVTVVAKDAPGGGKMLHAYIVSPQKVDITALHAFIAQEKPPYLVPAATLQIDAIPLTPNFKVDKRKLPEIKGEVAEEAPHVLTELEEELFGLVEDLVGHRDFSATTPLSLAGLSSITAMKLASLLMKTYGYSPQVTKLTQDQTILSLENALVHFFREGGRTAQSIQPTEQPQERVAEKSYPLSQSQLGVYLDSQSNMQAYNIPLTAKLPPSVDLDRLEAAIIAAVHAHPSLKCVIETDSQGDPMVVPQPEMAVTVTRHLLEETHGTFAMPEETVFQFHLPLFALRLFQGETTTLLHMEIHHVIGDGQSLTLLLEDIHRSYQGENLEPEGYTAFDFTLLEAEQRATQAYQQAKDYYHSVFQGAPTDSLPSGDQVDSTLGVETLSLTLPLSPQRVAQHCQQHNLSENALFTAGFALLLGKFTARDQVVFNQIHHGRSDPRSFGTVGMFVKTMPVCCTLNPQESLVDFVAKTHQHLNQLLQHHLYSYAEATQEFGLNNHILFGYQGEMMQNSQFLGAPLHLLPQRLTQSKAPLNIDIFKKEDHFTLELEYEGWTFSRGFVQSMFQAYIRVMEAMMTDQLVSDLSLLSPQDELVLKSIHDTAWQVDYKPAYRLLQDTAEAFPQRTAVVADGHTLTYQQLNQKANQVGHILQGFGLVPDDVVAVLLHRTHYVYVARQGVLKSGAAFLTIDPTYPEDRTQYMIEDSSAKALLVTRDVYDEKEVFFQDLSTRTALKILILDEIPDETPTVNLNVAVEPHHLAYCIYTSGSTGKPKGVMLTQKNLVNFVDGNPKNHEILGYTEKGRVSLAMASITFDVSIMEEFIPFAHGLTVVMATLDHIHNPLAMAELCLEHKVDIMSCTPSYLLNILDIDQVKPMIAQLKSIDFGAEAFPPSLYHGLVAINPDLYIMNGYGPTEATVSCTMGVVTQPKQITIGIPNSNAKVVMVDQGNKPLPVGALGEMVILGDGVGKGYVGRPDLTEQVFLQLWDMPAYKSGDFARILPDGNIEFHGRLDNQVKLRGLRVELGEIETAMTSFPLVKSALVMMKDSHSGAYLAAYFTAEKTVDIDALTAHLASSLTPYMVPSVFCQLEKFPLTSNRKIDKKQLPDTQFVRKEEAYVAPVGEIEEAFCQAMEKILGLERVSATSNFFELGGSSLSASKLAMMAVTRGYKLVYKDIFAHPTPREMAEICSSGAPSPQEPSGATTKPSTPEMPQSAPSSKDFAPQLAHNHMGAIHGIQGASVGNLLLTGATGFLGIHVLKSYLEQESGTVYCFMRKGRFEKPEQRLESMLAYYFEDPMKNLMGNRIICIDGSITDSSSLEQLRHIPFHTLINCAALVKHFVHDDSLYQANVAGVKNLIDLCMTTQKRMIQVSTTSVAGEVPMSSPLASHVLQENQLNFGQTLENAYLLTKYQGETALLEAISQGLDGKIMRVGNLMSRENDGEFQINCDTNGFMRQLRGYKMVGSYPVSAMAEEVEFSPIDVTAKAILLLSGTPSQYTLFHPYNSHQIFMSDVIRAMNHHNMPIDVLPEEEFQSALLLALEDEEKNAGIAGLVSYMDNSAQQKVLVPCDNRFTCEALYRLQFQWPITDMNYLERSLKNLDNFGFFDESLLQTQLPT